MTDNKYANVGSDRYDIEDYKSFIHQAFVVQKCSMSDIRTFLIDISSKQVVMYQYLAVEQ